jgi:outer membrane protein OmpA-like peptidoglycan-associated protein
LFIIFYETQTGNSPYRHILSFSQHKTTTIMSFNLIDTVKAIFTGNLITTAAASLGESEGGIQKALSGAIPAILAGLVSKASSHEGAATMLDMAKQAAGSGSLNNISDFLGGSNNSLAGKGADMLQGILGDKTGSLAGLISNFAGIKHSSSASVLSLIAPAALGTVGKYATETNMNADGLMNFLSSQKSAIMSALPAGLSSIAGLFGIGSATSATHNVAASAHTAVHHAEEPATDGSMKFLMPLFLGIFAVALGIYFFKGCGSGTKEPAAVTEVSKEKEHEEGHEHAAAATSTRELFKVKLPNDTVMDAYKGGIEDKLVSFLGTDYKKLGEDSLKNVWFDFDNLNFETGSAVITSGSQVQVNNIAAILKAFPSVKLKVGGYTDKVGDEAANKKLSDARAKAVQVALDKAGVGAQVTGAEGYGSAFAVYAADAPETDRVKDRHVSVSIR